MKCYDVFRLYHGLLVHSSPAVEWPDVSKVISGRRFQNLISHFLLEFDAHIWCTCSTREYFKTTKYQVYTRPVTYQTRTHFFIPEAVFQTPADAWYVTCALHQWNSISFVPPYGFCPPLRNEILWITHIWMIFHTSWIWGSPAQLFRTGPKKIRLRRILEVKWC